jgi:hypothetical protein
MVIRLTMAGIMDLDMVILTTVTAGVILTMAVTGA